MATAGGFYEVDEAAERARWRRAYRHSRHVRILRKALPISCALMTVAYLGGVLSKSGIDTGLPQIDIGRLAPTDLKMSNPKYDGFGNDGSSYNFAAKSAQQDLLKPGVVTLDEITGQLVQADKSKTDIKAKTGVYATKESVLDLSGGITVASESGLNVSLPNAQLKTKEALLTSPDPVVVAFPAGTINAVGLTVRHKLKEITFNSNVVAHLKQAPKPAGESAAVKAAKPAAAGVSMFGQSDAPLDVTSQRLDVNDLKKTATFSGNVRAVQGESVMETPELSVGYAADNPNQAAQPAAPGGALMGAAGKVKDIIAKGPVVMTRGTTDRVTSDSATFDVQTETGVLSGNVVMTSGPERRATGDRVDLDQRNERVLLSGGEVVVTQGQNVLRGQRLSIDRKTARTQLTSPQTGRVHATLVQSAAKKKANSAPPAVKAEDAAGNLNPFAAQFKTDPSAPMVLQAKQLDVDDNAKTAVFSGDVIAEQGDFVMRTPEMVATYSGASGIADVAATNPTTSKAPAAQISRIQAKQKVQVTTKDGRTVDGDWADVDMKTNMATVGGNVLLKQGQSVVRGTRLVIDMKSGESKLDTAPGQGGTGWQVGGAAGAVVQGGRPSATFFPQELKDAKKKEP